jgi:hypothetical protein
MRTILKIELYADSVKEALKHLEGIHSTVLNELKYDDESCLWEFSYKKEPEPDDDDEEDEE